jgi:protein SCO1/2
LKIKHIILLAFLFGIYLNVSSQTALNSFGENVEVGIVEHLGDTIPLDLTFQNEKDSTVHLRDLVDKPTIFTFVYFDCPGICSPLLNGVSDVVEQTDLVLGKDYQIITISFNINDDPIKAREKKENFLRKHSRENAKAWMYLTGDSANIYGIVNSVGFKFKQTGLDYMHAACIMIVSPKGKITRYLYGMSYLPIDLKMAIYESRKGLSRPGIARAMEFCYAYDPIGKRYALDVLKISGTLIIFFLFVFGGILFIRSKRKSKKVNNNE